MIRWALKLSEFNIEWEHRPGVQNVVADLLSRNPVDSVEGSQISCAALRALAINSREQFIKEQREDPELGHIYRYLENPDDGSVNATICESWSQDFKLINGLLFLREVRVYRPRQSDTISSDSPVETLYDEQEVSHGSNRSNQGQFKEHKKTSSQESEGCRSRQSNTTREIPRNKRKINSTASKDPTIKRSKICRKRSRQGDLIIRTGKDTLLNKGKESRDRSLPRSRPEISNLRDLIPLHQEYSPLQVHQSCLIAELLQLQVDPEWKLVDVITRPARPERQREDTTNKRRKQSRQIKPIQEELAHTIYGAVYKKKTESMRTSTTSKSTAYLAAYSAEEASVWKR
ncbi:retrovirus-related Pol polyprotein from transposon 297 [Trichonephila clavipes]|nr:retrovirus-related Pol polyprotein from transposon 297 [Trichonephila clavipes]